MRMATLHGLRFVMSMGRPPTCAAVACNAPGGRWCANSSLSASPCAESTEVSPPVPLEALLGGGAPLAAVALFHPFTGRLLRPGSAKAVELQRLGFEVDPSNTMRMRLASLPDPTSDAFKRLARRSAMAQRTWHRDLMQLLACCSDAGVQDARGGVGKSSVSVPSSLKHVNATIQALYEQRSLVSVVPKLVATVDTAVEGLTLTNDQQAALDIALRGTSLYIGGFAGTGKTMLMKAIHQRLSQRGLRVALTATTGVAAVHLGGCTFHHAMSIPVITSAKQQWDAFALRSIDVLIMDEVSLCDASVLQAFDETARFVRMNDKPFGGLQVIFSGDFLQLRVNAHQGELPCFRHPLFAKLCHVRLSTPLRHGEAGTPFFKLLNNLRLAQLDDDDRHWLFQFGARSLSPEAAEAAVYMFPKRAAAAALNATRLDQVPGPVVTFEARHGDVIAVGDFTSGLWLASPVPLNRMAMMVLVRETVREACNAPIDDDQIMFVGAELFDAACHPEMLRGPAHGGCTYGYLLRLRRTKGNRALSNGSSSDVWEHAVRGAVIQRLRNINVRTEALSPGSKLTPSADTVIHALEDKERELLRPIHVKVGCRVMITRNLSRTVINGSIGVVEAFARPDFALFPQGIVSAHLTSDAVTPDAYPQLPIVRLVNSGEIFQVPPVTTVVGGTSVSHFYGQEVHTLPVQLGYAFTVHKVQGLTVEGPVVINFEDFFPCPHLVYVAMSRVRRHEQLHIRGLDHGMVVVDKDCVAFETGDSTGRLGGGTGSGASDDEVAVGDWWEREHRRAASVSGDAQPTLPFALCAL